MDYRQKTALAEKIALSAGDLALDHFRRQHDLEIEAKGHQDFVSQADREVELLIREALSETAPEDSIVGEEHAPKIGTSELTWVIDPIDGTANFITGLPIWCVVIAGVAQGKVQCAVIHDPNQGETFTATRGHGAILNGRVIKVRADAEFTNGTICIGSSRRSPPQNLAQLTLDIVQSGGVFQRLGSGALGLAYTASGRYLGYGESHMNAWDCLAGQLLIEEAGGIVEDQIADAMIANGGRVIAAAPGVFDTLLSLYLAAFDE